MTRPHPDAVLAGVRDICATLPESEEYLMHGHPSFRAAKKCFVILGHDADIATVSIKVPIMDQPFFLEDPRFHRTHYIGQHGWVTLTLDGPVDWDEVRTLVTKSYRGAALKRMLKILDGG